MIYGYARVSTKGQAKDGNSLEAQEKELKEAGATVIYKDAFTGTKADRPEFDKLLEHLKEGDTLVVCKLDRFARSFSHGSDLVNDLIKRGIKVNVLNIGMMDNTPTSKLIRDIFFSFAEFERNMIIERTQAGKEIAKQRPDFKEGRPKKYDDEKLNDALELLDSGKSYSKVSKLTGISVSTLTRARRKQRAEQIASE